jgi:hypothetical protein
MCHRNRFIDTINVGEYHRSNRKWTIQRNWQHKVHKTQDEDKENNSTTQYGLDTTKHKTQDDDKQNKNDDKQNKKHNTICFGHHQTQDTRR